MKPKPLLRQLRSLGFDLSRYSPGTRTYYPKCSQCEVMVICGTPCHETGCLNDEEKRREHDGEEA